MTIHYLHRIPLADRRRVWPYSSNPACSICKEPVELETAKTDECGRAIHESCYLLKLASSVNVSAGASSKCPDRHTLNSVPQFRSMLGGRMMTTEERERLGYLCERIQVEQVPKAFDDLVMELYELLEQQQRTDPAGANKSKRVMKN